MSKTTPDICEYTGLPVETVRAMLDEASASGNRGEGIDITTQTQRDTVVHDIVARARDRQRDRDR